MPKIINTSKKQITDCYYSIENGRWTYQVKSCLALLDIKSEPTLYNHLKHFNLPKRGKVSDFLEIRELVLFGRGIAHG